MVMKGEPRGVHPAHMYASDKCGFLVTKANLHLLTDDQIEEWEDAIDEWFADHPDADPI